MAVATEETLLTEVMVAPTSPLMQDRELASFTYRNKHEMEVIQYISQFGDFIGRLDNFIVFHDYHLEVTTVYITFSKYIFFGK